MTITILIHAILFLSFWLTNLPYQKSLNDFLVGATSMRMNFLLLFMIFAGLVAVWSTLRLVSSRKGRKAGSSWLYLSFGIFFIVFFYGSFIFLFLKNSTQFYRLGQLFQYFRLFFDAMILFLMVRSLRRYGKQGSGMRKVLIFTGLIILWLVPVFIPPGNVYRGLLPEKPRLIAHRGAATLAPENTIASIQTAADLGVYGVETDVSVSTDGVLFLMHDSTLARTTDVAKVFPLRKKEPAENFNWDELSQLNAGSWFEGKDKFPSEHIPTLNELLKVVKENHLYFIYDLRIPTVGHPFTEQTLDLCLEEIKAAGVTDRT